MLRRATHNLLKVVKHLHRLHEESGVLLHLDIEPEPDGMLENSHETVAYFNEWLLPIGQDELVSSLNTTREQAKEIILRHLTVCYDVCHFAVEFESPREVMDRFAAAGIGIGKIQISSALKSDFTLQDISRDQCEEVFSSLDEPTYLHQVIARDVDGALHQYPDLPKALKSIHDPKIEEWRTHFHVPVFVESYACYNRPKRISGKF